MTEARPAFEVVRDIQRRRRAGELLRASRYNAETAQRYLPPNDPAAEDIDQAVLSIRVALDALGRDGR